MKAISFLLFIGLCSFLKTGNSEEVLQKMYKEYAGKWMHSFTFNQTTENYRNDSLVKTSTWYEAVSYPENFRIDFGDLKDGNAAIFTKDSIYDFRKGKLVRTAVNDDDLTFLLGGMYFYPFDTVKAKFNAFGYNLDKFYETSSEGKPVYVIGAGDATEKSNQVWIDKEKLVVVKFIKYNDGQKEEGVFEDHKRFGNSWSETSCRFYIDGKLFQKETYHDCKADEAIDLKIFDPYRFSYRE
jgi:hypothetical protein